MHIGPMCMAVHAMISVAFQAPLCVMPTGTSSSVPNESRHPPAGLGPSFPAASDRGARHGLAPLAWAEDLQLNKFMVSSAAEESCFALFAAWAEDAAGGAFCARLPETRRL